MRRLVLKDKEPTTHVPNDDQSLIERFNGLSLDDDTFFVPIQKAVDFNEDNCSKVRFIALAIEHMGIKILSLEEKNPHVNFLGVDKYLFHDYKFDIDRVPSIEIKVPCSELIQVGSMLTKIRPQQLCKDRSIKIKIKYQWINMLICSSPWLHVINGKTNHKSKFFFS